MQTMTETKLPEIKTALPGPKTQRLLEKDAKFISPSYTRSYPLMVERGYGAMIEDVDGNVFLDFNAGVAVAALGHAHPEIIEVITRASQIVYTHLRHGLLLPAADRACRKARSDNAWRF